jgi:hypothetical protein
MGAAIVGLVGVLVGAIVSGGATYLMARRAERRKARAAAWLVKDELERVETELRRWHKMLVEPIRRDMVGLVIPERIAVNQLLTLPEPAVWDEHKPMLAETLETKHWYALAAAYDCIDVLCSLRRERKLSDRVVSRWLEEEQTPYHRMVGQAMGEAAEAVEAGISAVSGLAGA